MCSTLFLRAHEYIYFMECALSQNVLLPLLMVHFVTRMYYYYYYYYKQVLGTFLPQTAQNLFWGTYLFKTYVGTPICPTRSNIYIWAPICPKLPETYFEAPICPKLSKTYILICLNLLRPNVAVGARSWTTTICAENLSVL